MKLKKTILTVPACLALMTSSADAALILEFNEVGGNVILTFSGEVDFTGVTKVNDDPTSNNRLSLLYPSGVGAVNGGGINNFLVNDVYFGDDLLAASFVAIDGNVSSTDANIGFSFFSNIVIIGSGLDSAVMDNNAVDVSILSANAGGVLHGKSQTYNTTFADSGLNMYQANTLNDMWRVTGTTGTDNLIQFRVNTVPEPSSTLLCGIAGLGLLIRRNRRG